MNLKRQSVTMFRNRIVPVAAIVGMLAATPASAIDVDAGDYTALPAKTNVALAYYQHAVRNELHAQGEQVPVRARLDSDIGILRGVHFMDIGGYIVDPQFLLPFGKLQAKDDLAQLGKADGVGDLILAATVWLTKPTDTVHFGVTPFLILPTGRYDKNKALNLGENRWKFILQAGYITPLTEKLTLDLIGDIQIHGENDEFDAARRSMKQRPLYQMQSWLRYSLGAGADVRVGVSHSNGGETKIDGVSQGNRTSTSKFSIGASYFVRPTTQLMVTYGQDSSVRDGFKESNRINLRLLQIL